MASLNSNFHVFKPHILLTTYFRVHTDSETAQGVASLVLNSRILLHLPAQCAHAYAATLQAF